jgi:hypothetical protein
MATIRSLIVDNPVIGLFTKAARLLRAAARMPRGAAMNDISVTTPRPAAVVGEYLHLLTIPNPRFGAPLRRPGSVHPPHGRARDARSR